MVNSRKRTKCFIYKDYVLVRPLRKLHAPETEPFRVTKRVGPNAYVLELPPKLGIRSTFNLLDVTEYREPAMIPSESFEPDPIFESESILECPQIFWPKRRKRIDDAGQTDLGMHGLRSS